MTPQLPSHQHASPTAFSDDLNLNLSPLARIHAQLDEIAGQGRWSYQLTVTGATFASLVHVSAEWQLVEYHSADRPLGCVLTSGRAIAATTADALHSLVAQIGAAVAVEDAFDGL